ncbi:LacI family DNA-binding transcriptional regulator [Paludicola sp. MB14-C6]|uniref:LacI family DNA-binding transcriptional regulator n=1 Tax=Paludihabitans sp. MB14-C6 TaxID=3070656 RepID=UPI0027DCCC1A|nr:LacI family DNA-binding transcriptional regulator [Paludicola sp. MB14-C6]WMJ23936.1 LacI family DNA-binding transcriptional regulator [Paludicola sp. MB14-C6]
MAVTIRQIAELAGVSRGTVDRVLNNRGGVSQEAEKTIKRIAKELNYKPNLMAKALANSQKGTTIGVLVNSGGNPFFDKVLLGIAKAQEEIAGFHIKVKKVELTGYNIEKQLYAINQLVDLQISGLVITPINDSTIAEKLNEVNNKGIPVVTLNADITGIEKLGFVGCNYEKSGQTAGELLGQITQGNATVGILTGSNKMLGHTMRVDGFQQVIEQSYPNITVARILETFDDDQIAYEQTKKLLLENQSINALYYCAGGIDGGIKAVLELGYAHKLKIITVDDTDNIKQYLYQGIVNATVCQQPFKQGYDAIKLVFNKLIYNQLPEKKHLYTQNEIKVKFNLD